TGTPDTVWLGQMGRAGDQRIVLVDEGGGQTFAYAGAGAVAYAGLPAQTETIFRIPQSRFLTSLFEYIGVPLDGILGLASFHNRQVIAGAEDGVLRVSP